MEINRYNLNHRLRQSGFALIPIFHDEFEIYLRKANFDNLGNLIESAEMRSLKHILMRIRVKEMILNPDELNFLSKLQALVVYTIRNLWLDESLSLDQVIRLSDWAWKNIAPSPLEWAQSLSPKKTEWDVAEAFANHTSLLLTLMYGLKNDRQEIYRKWIENNILDPLLPANPDLIDKLIKFSKRHIELTVDEIKNDKSLPIAETVCNLQPRQIRERLLSDDEFKKRFKIVASPYIIFGGADFRVDQATLILAIRSAYKKKKEISFYDLNNNKISLRKENDNIFLVTQENDKRYSLENFKIISPDQKERTKKLRELINSFGPASPDFSDLLSATEKRELTEDEVNLILSEKTNGVQGLQARACKALQLNQATIMDLIPNSVAYYEYFCGPLPCGIEPEEYIKRIFPDYRKKLLARDLPRGLDICLQGALRDDLSPGEWIKSYDNDEIWNAIESCNPMRDPIVLIGALDIAIYRQDDQRFYDFIKKAIAKLVEEDFLRPDGIDVYDLYPLLSEFAYNRISLLEGCASAPPYWKRMCAWMQAGYILNILENFKLDLEDFRKWVTENMLTAGMYAKFLDFQKEPMYRASVMDRNVFREEIFGRLFGLCKRYENLGREIPDFNKIEEALKNFEQKGKTLGLFMPGPIEGHFKIDKMIPESIADDANKKLKEDKIEQIIHVLSYFSQVYNLSGEIISSVIEVILKMPIQVKDTDIEKTVDVLIEAGLIACVHRNTELAKTMTEKIIGAAHLSNSEVLIGKNLQAIIIASAAYQDEDQWRKWLEEQLTDLAFRLPSGNASKIFLAHLREIKRVIKLALGIHCRAEAIAAAAF